MRASGLKWKGFPTRGAIQARAPKATLLDCSNLLRILRASKSTEELERLKRAAEISERAALQSLAQVRAGDSFSSVVKHYMGEIGAAGALFDHFAFTPRGLGIATEPGLEVRDYPILTPANQLRIRDDCIDLDSDLPLEANMVINLEASFFRPGVDSLNLEQSFVITAEGCMPLLAQDRNQPVRARG